MEVNAAQPGPLQEPTGEGRRFVLHAFVCVSDSACDLDGPAVEIRKFLKTKLKAAGLKEQMRINQSGCLGQCGHGPMMVVYPEGVWYCHLDLPAAERIWEEHLLGGKPVEELRFKTKEAGTNVLPMADAAARIPNVEHPAFSACARCAQR